MCRLLDAYDVAYDHNDTLNGLRRVLKAYIAQLCKSKNHLQNVSRADSADFVRRSEFHRTWPQLVPQTLKDRISQLFRSETCSEALQEVTCACCVESCLKLNRE